MVVAANMDKTSMRVPVEGQWKDLLTGEIVENPTVTKEEARVLCKVKG